MPLEASLNLSITGKQTSQLDLGLAAFPFALSAIHSLANGTGAGQADRVFTDTRTLGPSATENLDLAGVLLDVFGATLTFVTIKAVIIRANPNNIAPNEVQVTRPSANGVPLFLAASDGISLKAGYAFAWFGAGAGVAVTAGTGDLIAVTNSAGTNNVTYDVIVIGTSA